MNLSAGALYVDGSDSCLLQLEQTQVSNHTVQEQTVCPHEAVSRGTISRWIRQLLVTAGTDPGFKPHSTRADSLPTWSCQQGHYKSVDQTAVCYSWNRPRFQTTQYKSSGSFCGQKRAVQYSRNNNNNNNSNNNNNNKSHLYSSIWH